MTTQRSKHYCGAIPQEQVMPATDGDKNRGEQGNELAYRVSLKNAKKQKGPEEKFIGQKQRWDNKINVQSSEITENVSGDITIVEAAKDLKNIINKTEDIATVDEDQCTPNSDNDFKMHIIILTDTTLIDIAPETPETPEDMMERARDMVVESVDVLDDGQVFLFLPTFRF
ncbi:hypothetical protein BC830DRAFT_1082103 [Chytriomyces sp. MP71]|nr:hypothetical protein BC830DRAFT_1082103 [Chytriomyces sp. MP71]